MAIYNVVSAYQGPGKPSEFKVQGYPTGRTSCCVESESTPDRATAQAWADFMNANAGKDPPGVHVAQYADD